MEIPRTNELVYSPYTRIAMGIEDLVDGLQTAFLMFDKNNDTTADAAKFAQALYAKCFFTLPNNSDEEKSKDDYRVLVEDFVRECKMYQRHELDYEAFQPRFFTYLCELVYMKNLSGIRIRTKTRRNYTDEMKADVQTDLEALEKEDDYDESTE